MLLEIVILFLLVDHAQFETAVEGLDEWGRGGGDFFVDVVYFGLHGIELLPEQLDQLVVLLQVLVRLPR